MLSLAACGARTSLLEDSDVGGFDGVSGSAGNAGSHQAGSSAGGASQAGSFAASGAHSAGASVGGSANGGSSAGGVTSGGSSSAGASSGGSSSCVVTGPELCDGRDNDCNGVIDDANVCPCAVQNFGGRSYMFCLDVADWPEAEANCTPLGYHLTSVRDANADRFLTRTAASFANTRWWMGLNDLKQKGRWAWQAGTPVAYLDWAPGEPNDTGGVEDCGELNRFGPNGGWNDEPCDGALPYVCESGGP